MYKPEKMDEIIVFSLIIIACTIVSVVFIIKFTEIIIKYIEIKHKEYLEKMRIEEI